MTRSASFAAGLGIDYDWGGGFFFFKKGRKTMTMRRMLLRQGFFSAKREGVMTAKTFFAPVLEESMIWRASFARREGGYDQKDFFWDRTGGGL